MPDIELPRVESATVGTVGEPGQRVFYLQVASDAGVVTWKLEKQHVAALATALGEVLADLPPIDDDIPDVDLREPIEPEWAVAGMALSPWDEDEARLSLVLEELVGEDEEARTARIGLTATQMATLVARGIRLVAAGRPPCELCGRPMDPTGHVCPKTNGHATRSS